MAKMFYSLEEAADKLKMSPDQVTDLVSSGKLQEFRDRDKLVFKKDQVDMLADPGSTSDDSGLIPLADSNLNLGGTDLGLSLEDTGNVSGSRAGDAGGSGGGSGLSLEPEAKERSGIAIFDTDETDESDPMAVTRITDTGATAPGELTLENVGSGSGLLDLTREGDDTSLGADLLQDVYGEQGDTAPGETGGASGLFESSPAVSDVSAAAAPAVVVAAAEPYDGTWSGIAGGLALGAAIVCVVALATVLFGLIAGGDNPVVNMVRANLMMWIGILAAIVIVPAIVGLLVGKRSA